MNNITIGKLIPGDLFLDMYGGWILVLSIVDKNRLEPTVVTLARHGWKEDGGPLIDIAKIPSEWTMCSTGCYMPVNDISLQ